MFGSLICEINNSPASCPIWNFGWLTVVIEGVVIACNEGCLGTGKLEINCIQNPGSGREKLLGIGTLETAKEKKRVMVIGGGVAGLKVAEIAAKRGHEVALYEKTDKLGGQILIAEKMPYKAEISEVYRYLRYELQRIGVPVHTGCEISIGERTRGSLSVSGPSVLWIQQ